MKKMSGEKILAALIDTLVSCLEELHSPEKHCDSEFAEGEKTMCTECLEIIQFWEHADRYGLDWDIEARFPL